MPDVNLGTARGQVRIDYSSTGAAQATSALQKFTQSTSASTALFGSWARAQGLQSEELQRFAKIQASVTQAQKAAGVFEANLLNVRRNTASSLKQINQAESLAIASRQSLSSITAVLAKANAALPASLAGQGSKAARQVLQEFEATGKQHGANAGVAVGTVIGRGVSGAMTGNVRLAASGLTSALGGIGVAGGLALGGIALAAIAAAGAIATAGMVLKQGFAVELSLETAKQKLEALGATGNQTASVMESIRKSTDGTRFSMAEMSVVATKAFSIGIKPGEGMDGYLKSIADIATIAQVPLGSVVQIFDQVTASGKVGSREIRQLSTLGINVLPLLAKQMNMSMAEVRKLANSTGVDIGTVLAAIESKFGGAATKLGGFSQEIAKIKISIENIGAAILAPLFGGENLTGPDKLAQGAKKVREEVDKLVKFFETHQEGVVSFWEVMGKGAIMTAGVVTNSVGAIVAVIGLSVRSLGEMTGLLVEGVADAMRGIADVIQVFGGKGVADNIRKGADAMSRFSQGALQWGKGILGVADKIFGFNETLQKSWQAIDRWKKEAQDAIRAPKKLGDQLDDTSKQLITIDEALEKLGVTQEDASKSIMGTEAQFKKFLQTLRDKRAPQELIDTLTRLRENFVTSGAGAVKLGQAIDQLGDQTVTADDKAKALITSLQTLGVLPGEAADSMAKYNESLNNAIKWNSGLVDVLDTFGEKLRNNDGTINTTSKNGQTLQTTIEGIRNAMYTAAAAGNDPNTVWQQAHDSLMILLADFGIVGPTADEIINKYLLPKHDFTLTFQLKGKEDVQKDLAALIIQIDAAKAQGQKNLDWKVAVHGDPNDLKRVVESLGLQWKEYDPLTQTATIVAPPDADLDKIKQGLEGYLNTKPTDIKAKINVLPINPQDAIQQATGGNPLHIPAILDFQPIPPPGAPGAPPPVAPVPAIPPGPPPSPNIGGGPGGFDWGPSGAGPSPNVPGQGSPPPSGTHWVQKPDGTWEAAPDNPVQLPPSNPLEPPGGNQAPQVNLVSYHQAGVNISESVANGILDGSTAVTDAINQVVTEISDYLPMSPAKKGPLSGSGSAYSRGIKVSTGFAQGISAGTPAVSKASAGMASGTSPMDDVVTKFLKDMGEWSQLGQHVLSFANSLSNITFSVLQLAQTMSGGKLFPKSYVKDPKAALDLQARQMRPGQPGYPGIGQYGGGGGQQANQTPAVSAGGPLTPQDAELASALKQHGFTESQIIGLIALNKVETGNWSHPESIMGFTNQQTGPGISAHVGGFKEMWDRRQRTGAVVSAGHPDSGLNAAGEVVDPEKYANWLLKLEGYSATKDWAGNTYPAGQFMPDQEYARKVIAAYKPGAVGPGLPAGPLTRPAILRDTGNVPTQARGVQAAALIAQLFPGITDIGGSRPPGAGTAPGTHDIGRSIDVSIPANQRGPGGLGDQIQAWLAANAQQLGVETTIWRDIGKNYLGGASGGPGTTFSWPGHQDHIDVRFLTVDSAKLSSLTVPLAPAPSGPGSPGIGGTTPQGQGVPPPGVPPGSPWVDAQGRVHYAPISPAPALAPGGPTAPVPGLPPGPPPTPQAPLPVQDNQLNATLPPALQQLAAGDQLLQDAFNAYSGRSQVNNEQTVPMLQHIDSLITDQNNLNTPQGKATADALGQLRSGLMQQQGLTEGPDALSQAQQMAGSISGLASDVFGVIDDTLKSIGSAKEIGDTLVRGIANTQDINRIVDNVQTFIELAAQIAQTTSDALGLAGQLAGASGSMGGEAGSALSAASAIAGIIGQAFQAVNAGIDIAQEIYRIGTKYLGRGLEGLFGLPGAPDIKYLLDTVSGQLQVYTSDNPQNKKILNTLGRELHPGAFGSRPIASNQFIIYQGPGQDPRDTMSDAMFAIKTSGVGAFGYVNK